MTNKRKRCINFTLTEKMRFIRILEEKGQIIIARPSAHDLTSNRLKESAWEEITELVNASSSPDTFRSTKSLKKLWQKLKSDAKVLKSVAYHPLGAGDPLENKEDPILNLVADITGRTACDEMVMPILNDDDSSMKSSRGTMSPRDEAVARVGDATRDDLVTRDSPRDRAVAYEAAAREHVAYVGDIADCDLSSDIEIMESGKSHKSGHPFRKQPLSHGIGERSPVKRIYPKLSRLDKAKLQTERAKVALIQVQMENMKELQALEVGHLKKMHAHREDILKCILRKVQDGVHVEADILKMAFTK